MPAYLWPGAAACARPNDGGKPKVVCALRRAGAAPASDGWLAALLDRCGALEQGLAAVAAGSEARCEALARQLQEERAERQKDIELLRLALAAATKDTGPGAEEAPAAGAAGEEPRVAEPAPALVEAAVAPAPPVAEEEAVSAKPSLRRVDVGDTCDGCSVHSAEASTGLSSSSHLPPSDTHWVQVHFRVLCETQPGFHVRVVGSHEDLGDWDPASGLRLGTSAEQFPKWHCTHGPRVKLGTSLEYKFVICSEDLSSVEWEDGDNRVLELLWPTTFVLVSEALGGRSRTTEACERLPAEAAGELGAVEPAKAAAEPTDDDAQELDHDELGASCAARYRLAGGAPLGRGSFGAVWRCERLEAAEGPPLAAKLVRRSLLEPRDVANLLGPDGEIKTHLALRHTNIVQLLEHFEDDKVIAMVMDCCLGGDLFDAIERSRASTGVGLSEAAAGRMMQHVLSALAHLHASKIVHRDIKTENVLLSLADVPLEENVYKLCDFGFAARVPGAGEGLTDRVGSPMTVAPEIVEGKPYGCAVDLWSAGVVLYMALSTRAPFNGQSSGEVLKQVVKGAYSFEGDRWAPRSMQCKSFLGALMTRLPSTRPSAVKALGHAWLSAAA